MNCCVGRGSFAGIDYSATITGGMAMNEEFSTEYLKYFNIKKRVNVNISFDDGCFFNEWGEVRSFRGRDQIEIVFSSDLPPEGVRLGIGTALELRAIVDETRYSCHGIVVGSDSPRFFTIRLIGDVITDDPREFYRINAFLPLTYRVEPVGNPRNAESERPSPPTPIAANISGGGLRSWFPEKLEKDRLVELLLYIPLPNSGTRSIPVVGKVVHVRPEPLGTPTRPLWDTAIHFQKIDEHDRDENHQVHQFGAASPLKHPGEVLPGRTRPRESECAPKTRK